MNNTSAKETTNESLQNPLGYKPIGRLLLLFAVPSIISFLVNSVYNIVDQIFIGQGVGYLGNAATTVAFPMVTIMSAFAAMIGAGGCAYASIKLGEGETEKAQGTLNNLLLLSIGTGILFAILGLIFLEPMLRAFGATDTVMPYAKEYASVILLGAPFAVISIGLSGMVRADGSPQLSMYGILIGAALNTVLDPLYIFVFHWGVRGAAIATITSQLISCIILGLHFTRRTGKPGHMRFEMRLLKKPNLFLIRRIVTFGISAGITSGVATLMQVVMNNSLVYYGNRSEVGGDVALSAMGVVMKIAMILASVALGIGTGAQPILGFNIGARHFHRVRRTYIISVLAATISITLCWAFCQLFPGFVLQLFGNSGPAFTTFAIKCLKIYLFGIFCAGFQIVSTNYFQATGQPLKASILSMLRQLLLLIPLLLILPLFFGLDGVLFSAPIADIVSAVIVAFFIVPEMGRLKVSLHQEDKELAAHI